MPGVFFSEVLPAINDIAELKVLLYVFEALYGKRGYPKFISLSDLASDKTLLRSLKMPTGSPEEALIRGLELSVGRGTLLHVMLKTAERIEDLYFLNTDADRRAVAKIESGELVLSNRQRKAEIQSTTLERPNIFALYEQNIGILTPLIADQLRETEELYPTEWIEDAFKEAVQLNKRNLRYIVRILESWATEGKQDGKSGRNLKEDTEKYFRGKFGHLVRR